MTLRTHRARAKLLLGSAASLVYVFLYLPLLVVIIYAFNSAAITTWPPSQPYLHWFQVLWNDPDPRDAFVNSVKQGLNFPEIDAVAVVVIGTSIPIVLLAQFLTRESEVKSAATEP